MNEHSMKAAAISSDIASAVRDGWGDTTVIVRTPGGTFVVDGVYTDGDRVVLTAANTWRERS